MTNARVAREPGSGSLAEAQPTVPDVAHSGVANPEQPEPSPDAGSALGIEGAITAFASSHPVVRPAERDALIMLAPALAEFVARFNRRER